RPHGDIWADDHGHLPLRQIRRECRQPIELVLRPAKFDRDVVAVDEPGFLQAVAECRYPVNGIGSRGGIKETDDRHRRLLRPRRPRRRRAAEKRDEHPASHSRPQGVKTTHRIVSQPSRSWNGLRGMRTATNCSGLEMSALGPTTGSKPETSDGANVFRFAPESRSQRLITTCRMSASSGHCLRADIAGGTRPVLDVKWLAEPL